MIELQDLEFGYGAEPFMPRLSLHLKAGQLVGVFGKNGAGKTTLLKLISGVLTAKRAEQYQIAGENPAKRRASFLSQIYFVTENPPDLPLTMREHVNLYSTFYPHFDLQLLSEYLDRLQVNIDDKLTELSYGGKRKYALAFGLATIPNLLLLDEPLSGLDIFSQQALIEILEQFKHPERLIIIADSHLQGLENLVDTVVLMHRGEIILKRTPSEISSKFHFFYDKQKTELRPEIDEYSQTAVGTYYSEQGPLGFNGVETQEAGGTGSAINFQLLIKAFLAKQNLMSRVLQGDRNGD